MADLSKLKRQRGHIQTTITNLKKHHDQAISQPASVNKYLIQASLDTVTKAFEKFESIQDNIEELDEEEIDHRITYIESFICEKARALELLDKLNPPPSTGISALQSVNSMPMSNIKSAINLPPITLKPFDGTPEKWTEFFNLFSAVIGNKDIQEVEKLNYLKSSLTGKASRAIESLEITNDNYSVAISILKDKFENPRRMARRHTLLHIPVDQNTSETSQHNAPSEQRQVSLVVNALSNDIMVTSVLDILDKDERPIQYRGLLDTCSTTNFITQRLADNLKLKKTVCNVPVGTLNSMTTYCNELTTATIKSHQPIQRELIKLPANIKLADPDFHRPAPVDILLGAGTTLSLLSVGQIKLSAPNQQELYLQKTMLGWIFGGAASSNVPSTSNCHITTTPVDFDLQKFWEVEEYPKIKKFSEEEEKSEQHYRKHVSRDTNGRYVVALPFNPHAPKLGKFYHFARKGFDGIERKLNQSPELKILYEEVLDDYLNQRHMSSVVDDPLSSDGYYLPHHAVIKETSLTTKVRVVYDSSLKTSTGVFLNDVLYTGPSIQPDLFTTLIRFREHPIVITGDLKQIYRQFLVRKEDRKFQRISWKDQRKNLQIFELNTVTFGITCASYLAIRCLHQLSIDEGEKYPVASPLFLTSISSDPTDPIALTPGHFLIGDSLTNLRGRDYSTTLDNRLSHWEHLQKVKQHFWTRWSKEYLNELTVRTKWEKAGPEIHKGAVVLLREDNLPPAQWAQTRKNPRVLSGQ